MADNKPVSPPGPAIIISDPGRLAMLEHEVERLGNEIKASRAMNLSLVFIVVVGFIGTVAMIGIESLDILNRITGSQIEVNTSVEDLTQGLYNAKLITPPVDANKTP